ncbi:MAG: UDP-N-acetylmuramoyl-L-alanine--D-glutamate ligase [Gemmatimonadetes bacterium]|nr:UDP-N-acetylmuramoyl-L-alanine--D-glutamate ligase [Gemmatimonadota bacterium]
MAELRHNGRGPALQEATVVVLGYGQSGRAAATLLQDAGARVRVFDNLAADRLGLAEEDVPGGTAFFGAGDDAVLSGADLVIASPGLPPTHPVLAAALKRGLPVRSELELGWWFTDCPTLAITGTNGKTTTTELLGAMARAAGRKTVVAGIVGTPLSSIGPERPDVLILEVSSFQLFLCEDFRPDVAMLLNFTSDHQDWHPDLDHYADAKARLFARQGAHDAAILPGDTPEIVERFRPPAAEVYEFRREGQPERGAFLRDGRVTFRLGEELESVVPLSEWHLPGGHNLENLLAASLGARLLGLPDEAIRTGARDFRGLPHRMEFITEHGGVAWINDSKSTNPGSLEKALDPDVPTLLIAGGVTKGCDFRPVRDAVTEGARTVLLIGEGMDDLETAWAPSVRTVRADTLERAVEMAAAEAAPGERVLFSPGCASFDQFENYVHRGNRFRELVMERTGRKRPEGGVG